jgi:hypothetical protein
MKKLLLFSLVIMSAFFTACKDDDDSNNNSNNNNNNSQQQDTALTFVDSTSFDISTVYKGTAIKSVTVSRAVFGGTRPYTFSATGLPAGISISGTGVISGTPTATASAGTATIKVTDAANTTKTITINYAAITEPTLYDLYVANIHVSDANKNDILGDGKVSYNASTKKLTINSASIDGAYWLDPNGTTASIYAAGDLTIEMTGASYLYRENYFSTFGIFVSGTLTFTGSGSLYIISNATGGSNLDYYGYGIYAGTLAFNKGTVTIQTSYQAVSSTGTITTGSGATITVGTMQQQSYSGTVASLQNEKWAKIIVP